MGWGFPAKGIGNGAFYHGIDSDTSEIVQGWVQAKFFN